MTRASYIDINAVQKYDRFKTCVGKYGIGKESALKGGKAYGYKNSDRGDRLEFYVELDAVGDTEVFESIEFDGVDFC